jgi:hypothetical protein
MMMSVEKARELLNAAEVFFDLDEDDDDPKWEQTLNLNDCFFWASADGEYVEDKDLPEVARLFWKYGHNGILYWAWKKTGADWKPEFFDVRRAIEFVKHEEDIRDEEPDSNKRAYLKKRYTIGES